MRLMSAWIARVVLAVVSVTGLVACSEPMYGAASVAISVRASSEASTLDTRERQVIVRVYRHTDDGSDQRLPVVFDDRFLGTSTSGGLDATPLRFTPERPRATVFLVPGTFTFDAVALEGVEVVGRASAANVTLDAAGTVVELDFTSPVPAEP